MASSAAAVAAAEAEAAAEAASTDGPVLSLMSKRLRALRKKYKRIVQMEERVAQGKPLNTEQEEVLRSKPAVTTLIDEYEKLRLPLSSAVQEELSRLSPAAPPKPSATDASLEDLIGVLYFGCLFDVKPQAEFTATMLARTHERSCCLTYDYVTDEATELLGERDLDAISSLGTLVTSRPASSGVSHKNALQGCVEHARLLLRSSDQPIHPGASVTYAGLREKVNKIMASDYFTTTPEMKAPVDMAAAVGKYTSACQVQVPDSTTVPALAVQIDGSHQKEDEQEDLQAAEVVPDQFSPVDEPPEDEADMLNPSGDITSSQQEQQKPEADVEEEQNQRDFELEQQYFPRRGYQNQRGRGGGGGSGNGSGGRRGYPNGRGGGGRGGRGGGGGGYQNGGRNQFYDPGYYPRNYYNTRGRGGRSGGPAVYNNHHGAAATLGGPVPANAE